MDASTRAFLRRRLRILEPDRWVSALIWDWAFALLALVLVGAALSVAGPWKWAWLVPAMLLLGACQHRLALLAHEGAHGLALGKGRANDVVTCLFALWPLGLSLQGYRAFHFAHHATFGTATDPERIHTRSRWLGQWNLPVRPHWLALQLAGDLVGGGVPHLGMAAYLTRPRRFTSMLGPLGMMAGAFVLGWLVGALWLPTAWYGAVWSTFWLMFRLRIMVEHIVHEGENPTLRFDIERWWAWPIRFAVLPHAADKHWEHHLDPNVPWYNLDSLRNLTYHEEPILTPAELVRHHTRAR